MGSNLITIGDSPIGPRHPCFVIAEISANHLQDRTRAKDTVCAAAEAGANAVKFQTYDPDLITINSDEPIFRVNQGTVWDGRTLHSIYSEGFMPWGWHEELFDFARALGLVAFSSPFDPTAVDLLASLDVPAYKVASFEITDIPLIEHMASQGKPVLISTGIAREVDIEKAIAACRRMGNDQIVVLKCTSLYPAPAKELNLRTIPDIALRFDTLVGFSDHTLSATASLGAVALGACVIERHITLDRSGGGLDAEFSTTPDEFNILVNSIRELEEGLGNVTYDLSLEGQKSRCFARSLFVVKDVVRGQCVTEENVKSMRPNAGLPPEILPSILGKEFSVNVLAGTPLEWGYL